MGWSGGSGGGSKSEGGLKRSSEGSGFVSGKLGLFSWDVCSWDRKWFFNLSLRLKAMTSEARVNWSIRVVGVKVRPLERTLTSGSVRL